MQGGNLPWEASTHKFTLLFKLVVTWSQVTNQKDFISTITMAMVTKFIMVETKSLHP